MQLDSRNSFESALEAQLALDDVLSGETGYIAAPIALESFLARYEECATRVPQAAQVTQVAQVPRIAQPPVAEVSRVTQVDPVTQADRVAQVNQVARVTTPTDANTITPPPAVAVASFERTSVEEEALREEALREAFRAQAAEPTAPVGVAPKWRLIAIGLAVVAIVETGIIVWSFGGAAISSARGTVVVESKPSGAHVKIDGQEKGVTPLSTKVPAGTHVIEITSGGEPRVIPMSVEAGRTFAQYVELVNGASLGRLAVASTPPGASILLDGQPRGTAPTEIPDVPAGDHELTLELNGMRVRQPVSVTAGTTTTAAIPMTGPAATSVPPPPPTTGVLLVNVPFEMKIFEGGELVGVTGDRLTLQPGSHELQVVSETLAFKTELHAEIVAGRSTRLTVPLPKGVIHLNAAPWAEVWIDGAKVGETPIGNLPITIGPHEIVFKHPDLGEQHHAATVTAGTPVRLSVDLRKPQ